MPPTTLFRPLRPPRSLYAPAAAACLVLWSGAAVAADKGTFLTSWFAQAEHGGVFQAKATRPYRKAGPPRPPKSGGPQAHALRPLSAKQGGVPVKFFLFAADGYPPYGTTMVTTRPFVDKHPDAVARFVKASLEGWRSYLHNPAPANALIKIDNPRMSDEQIAFGVEQLKALKVLDGGDAQTLGIGMMTEARWKATYDFMVAGGLLKPEVDWKQGFTDRFVKSLKLSM